MEHFANTSVCLVGVLSKPSWTRPKPLITQNMAAQFYSEDPAYPDPVGQKSSLFNQAYNVLQEFPFPSCVLHSAV